MYKMPWSTRKRIAATVAVAAPMLTALAWLLVQIFLDLLTLLPVALGTLAIAAMLCALASSKSACEITVIHRRH